MVGFPRKWGQVVRCLAITSAFAQQKVLPVLRAATHHFLGGFVPVADLIFIPGGT